MFRCVSDESIISEHPAKKPESYTKEGIRVREHLSDDYLSKCNILRANKQVLAALVCRTARE